MKNFKLGLAGLATIIGLSTIPALAQRAGGTQQPDLVAQMTLKLDLSKVQQTKIRAIIQDTTARIGRIHTDPKALQNIKKRDAEERDQYFDETAKILAVLTPDQRTKWSPPPKSRWQRELDQLDLDASQEHKIAALVKEMYAEMQAAPEDQRRARLHTIRDAYRSKIEAVLTPAQKQKFEAAH